MKYQEISKNSKKNFTYRLKTFEIFNFEKKYPKPEC